MPGLGTLVNAAAIIVFGVIGTVFGNRISENIQESLMTVNGVAVLFIGAAGTLGEMFVVQDGALQTQGTMMMIGSLCIGVVIGELFRIEYHIEKFGEWLKARTGNSDDATFVNGFVTASLTVCIGAMAVVGALQDGMTGNHAILFTKAVLDAIIILVMSASLGKGCIFSFIPVGIFQGSITLLARLISPFMTDAGMNNLDLVGSVMIFCVGINLVFDRKIRVANMLPGLIISVAWAAF